MHQRVSELASFLKTARALSLSCKPFSYSVFHDSAIGQHLFDYQLCAFHYNNDRFFILSTGRFFFFHLSALEATFIKILLHNL